MYIYSDIYELKGVPYLYVACKGWDVQQLTLCIKVQQATVFRQTITKADLDIHGVWCKPWEDIIKYPDETLWFYYEIQDVTYYLQKMKFCERKIVTKEKVAYPVVRRDILEFKELIERIGERYE